MEELSPEQKHKVLFMQLVLMFQQAAWHQMGKLPNPITNKIERDLEQARLSIDTLDMIKARTKGNLSDDETRMLDHVLRELKLNFVDELDKDQKKTEPPASASGSTTEPKT
ncbi:MAG: DUF1844 domain-containing protein [candidate division KSB1 bacterium]|nr:DUF1844 domain-containing protein [candidate division KSB1 bacterium]MDZ7303368.1 DUF1844 domain-containing protein [candidate division KSB1 bacterium]MDZ7312314.1 DUF1844 domain-containing protein [candidate division KSB1 bacterium]